MQQTPPLTSQQAIPNEQQFETGREFVYDFEAAIRTAALSAAIQRRQGLGHKEGEFSSRFVLEEAGWRYFSLLAIELADLQVQLTEEEFVIILNTTASPVSRWLPGMTLAGAVADDYGIQSLDENTKAACLVRKLAYLTPAQCLALVDVCEQFWRVPSWHNSVAEFARDCGLKLA